MFKVYGHAIVCSELIMYDIDHTCKVEFSVMQEEKKKNGEKYVNLYYCEAWDSAAEFIFHNVQRGSELYIEAFLRNERWGEGDDKKSKVVLRLTSFKVL